MELMRHFIAIILLLAVGGAAADALAAGLSLT
jgi:hypothetical protein